MPDGSRKRSGFPLESWHSHAGRLGGIFVAANPIAHSSKLFDAAIRRKL
jgi:hypothetical protein